MNCWCSLVMIPPSTMEHNNTITAKALFFRNKKYFGIIIITICLSILYFPYICLYGFFATVCYYYVMLFHQTPTYDFKSVLIVYYGATKKKPFTERTSADFFLQISIQISIWLLRFFLLLFYYSLLFNTKKLWKYISLSLHSKRTDLGKSIADVTHWLTLRFFLLIY